MIKNDRVGQIDDELGVGDMLGSHDARVVVESLESGCFLSLPTSGEQSDVRNYTIVSKPVLKLF